MRIRRLRLEPLLLTLFAVAIAELAMPSHRQPRSAFLEASFQVPSRVRPVLDRACLDCHSNETHWPWSSRIPPFSWLIQHDVELAREKLNFSYWTRGASHLATKNEIQEICDAVSDGDMPPRSYRLMHPEARLSEGDKNTLCDWADEVRNPESDSSHGVEPTS
jgi:hypothetical protein